MSDDYIRGQTTPEELTGQMQNAMNCMKLALSSNPWLVNNRQCPFMQEKEKEIIPHLVSVFQVLFLLCVGK